MKTLDEPPVNLIPFDIDRDLSSVNAYILAAEMSIYDVNSLIGVNLSKSSGVRMGFDVFKVQSLINPDSERLYIHFGPSISGVNAKCHDSREIAGMVDGQLWFTEDGNYFSALDDINHKMEMIKSCAEPLREAFDDMKRMLEHPYDEGEDWKN